MNIAGQVIYSDNLNQFAGEYKKAINLHENASGIYYLQVITDDEVINKKIIKQ